MHEPDDLEALWWAQAEYEYYQAQEVECLAGEEAAYYAWLMRPPPPLVADLAQAWGVGGE